jgi:MinD-like ATPase involved in chromosome partitioning or flagellar assembly
MSILCEPTARAAELTLSIGGEVRAADSLSAMAQMLDKDPAETLVVIGPETPAEDALAFAAALRLERPTVSVILAREQLDVCLLTRALQSGVREVVAAGDHAALTAACSRAREVSRRLVAATGPGERPVVTEGQVITVFAAKGGCGKTMLAVNLSVALARAGRRVCLVDLDLAFGDVAISMQLDPARTVLDALPMAGHVDITGAASLLTRYRPGLDALLAPVSPGDADKVPPALVGELLGVLRGMVDYVVVDTPAGFNEHVLTALDASSHHVLVTTPDVPTLKNLRLTLDMLDLLAYPREIRSVVLNRSGAKVGLTQQDVDRVARCRIAAHIPASRAVPVSVNKGTPITLARRGHAVSRAITRFAEQRLVAPGVPDPRRARSRRRDSGRAA